MAVDDRKIYPLRKNVHVPLIIYGADNITCRVTYYCSFEFNRKGQLNDG